MAVNGGVKNWASGQVLDAADLNEYVADQTIARFATIAARTAAYGVSGAPALQTGMFSWVESTEKLYYYDGTSWEEVGAQVEDGEITEAKLASGAVTEAKLADSAVTSAKIADGTIVNADVNASAAIAHSKLASITAGRVLIGNSSNVPTATALSGDVTVNSTGVTAIASGVIVNADVNASAAIDKTKISGTAITAADTGTVTSTMIADGTIVNSDINASAAIALSKLSSGTSGQIIVANSSGVPTWVSESGDVTISDTGVTAISSGVIVNADVNASAAIAYSKLNLSGSITSSDIADGTIVNADISDSASIGLGKLADATIDEKSASYTIVLTDKNKFIKMNVTTTANTVTVPTNASAAFPVGSQIHIIQYGSGKTQVVGDSGVVVYSTPGAYLRAQYSSATLLKCDTNTWMLMGDLSAS
jgi:sporulation protein YlmC with PRC-barrel domain